MYTRQCLRMTLATCDFDQQDVVIATFREIECLALDICPTGAHMEEEPVGEPAECIDRNIVTGDYECNPYMALHQLRQLADRAPNPFLPVEKRKEAFCM